MTEDQNDQRSDSDGRIERLLDGTADSRRSFMKKGALASGTLALGASGTALAQQDDGGVGDLDDNWKALTFISNFHPNSTFAFVSGVTEWVPNYGDVRDSWFSDYNTYHIRWQNTDSIVPLFVAKDADLGEYDDDLGFIPDQDDTDQPQLYEMNREWTPFGDNERLITVNASPVGEDEEDAILDTDDWWDESDDGGGGTGTTGNDTSG